LNFYDNDFYNCNLQNSIKIEITLKEIPTELMIEDKFGLLLRGLDKDGKVVDDIEEAVEPALTIRLEVGRNLEPVWSVITEREIEIKLISASDRAKFNSFLVSDYLDRHFTWGKGSPLYSLLMQETQEEEDDSTMLDALREAKLKIDGSPFSKFDPVINKIKKNAESFGIDISKARTTIDFKDLVIIDGRVCLHDSTIPFRQKGKGSKRLISMAIQDTIAEAAGIVLIDEIEQGLEPDRVQSLVNTLKKKNKGQIFITTHSRDVLVELDATDLLLVKENSHALTRVNPTLQGLLRKNPEAFFAKKVVVGEGATEIGICRALSDFRIRNGQKNSAYLGVRFADGSGNQTAEYCEGLIELGLPTSLFCDSDVTEINAKKAGLIAKGVKIFDWKDSDSIEMAIIKDLPFPILKKIFELAVQIRFENDPTLNLAQHEANMWDSVKAHFGSECPASMAVVADSVDLRNALGISASKNQWFKRQDKSYRLGEIIFENIAQIPDNTLLKKNLLDLSTWIDE
jgi:energy-coupling factor transporter ATP-binding protein EcfA2